MATFECEKAAPAHKSALLSFIKSLATCKGDLASLTAPPFLLSPQSMVEFSAFWSESPSLFVAPACEPDAERRALLVLKWFMSTLAQQHKTTDDNGKRRPLKPLNPFLGETFMGKWSDEETGTTELVAEQVSHHPPVTAFNIWNDKHGIRLQGNVAPKTYFSTTVNIERKGYSVLHIDRYDEDYVITMPKIHIEGIMTGALNPELSGITYIRSSSGYTAKIEYLNKGWISGTRNSFVASLYHNKQDKRPLYTIEGQWSGEFRIKSASGKVVENLDATKAHRLPLQVAPVEQQHPMESRRAWQHVADAIRKGDVCAVGSAKSKIENEQRDLRKREKSAGREFQRRYFREVASVKVAEGLTGAVKGMTGLSRREGGGGVWEWDSDAYRRMVKSDVRSPTRRRFDSGISGVMLDPNGEH